MISMNRCRNERTTVGIGEEEAKDMVSFGGGGVKVEAELSRSSTAGACMT